VPWILGGLLPILSFGPLLLAAVYVVWAVLLPLWPIVCRRRAFGVARLVGEPQPHDCLPPLIAGAGGDEVLQIVQGEPVTTVPVPHRQAIRGNAAWPCIGAIGRGGPVGLRYWER
jgi:hypothetical protein